MTGHGTQPDAVKLNPGDRIGKFKLVRQIARGGTADVWQGQDELLDQPVAIKHLIVTDNDDDAQAMRECFIAEAQLQKKVSSNAKHLVRLIDIIDEPRGLFLISELVKGLSLEQRLERSAEPVGSDKVIEVLKATGMALQVIHNAGVLHRDLKPSNILLPQSGGLKVGDFGLATLMQDQDLLTIGSVRYMSPELFSREPVDGRADIYSLGMIVYELAAGREKFNEAFKLVLRDQRNQPLRWMKWHTNLRAEPALLSSLNPELPAWLSNLIMRMMEKDPSQRIASADQLVEAIQRHSDASGPEPDDETVPELAPADAGPAVDTTAATGPLPKSSRLPWLVTAAAIVLVLAIITPLAWTKIDRAQKRHRDHTQAIQRFNEAHGLFKKGQYKKAMAGFSELARSLPHDQNFAEQAKDKCRAYILLCEAHAYHNAGRYEEALEKITEADGFEAIRPDRETIVQFRGRVAEDHAFEQIIAQIKSAIEQGSANDARRLLREQSQHVHTITKRQGQRIADLGAKVEAMAAQRTVDKAYNGAESLIAQEKFAQAAQLLEYELQRRHNDRMESLLADVHRKQKVARLLKRAQSDINSDRLGKAVKHLAEALAAQPDKKLATRIRNLKGKIAYGQGKELEQMGEDDAARDAYLQASGFGYRPAEAAIKRLKIAGQIDAVIRAGDAAMAAREFEAAIEHYLNAIKHGGGQDVETRLRSARVRLNVDKAHKAAAAGDIDAARSHYQSSLDLDATHLDAQRGLERIDQRKQYLRLLAKGDAERKKGNFGAATRMYRRARKSLRSNESSDEIDKRLDDNAYEQLVAQARYYIQIDNWIAARAKLMSAVKIHGSQEAKQLLNEVNSKLTDSHDSP